MTDLEEKTGITRSQLYRWINGDAKNIQQKSFQAVAHNLGYVITNAEDGIEVTHHIQTQGEPEVLQQIKDKERIIALQDEKIAQLENALENKQDLIQEQIDSIEWNAFNGHFHTVVTLDWPDSIGESIKRLLDGNIVGRSIDNVDNLDIISEYLGYSISELEGFFDIGAFHHKFKDHPIEQIVYSKSREKLLQTASDIPALWRAMKNSVQNKICNFYTPVDYIAKDGSIIHSDSLSIINFENKVVQSKTTFTKCDQN
jgi:transcriptional regulator with XRE-family HTH domain